MQRSSTKTIIGFTLTLIKQVVTDFRSHHKEEHCPLHLNPNSKHINSRLNNKMKAHHQELQVVSTMKEETICTIRDPVAACGVHIDFTDKEGTEQGSGRGEPQEEMGQSRIMGATWKRVFSGQKEMDLGQGKKRWTNSSKRKAAQEDIGGESDNQNHTEHFHSKNAWHSVKPSGLQNSWRCTLIPKDNWILRSSLMPSETTAGADKVKKSWRGVVEFHSLLFIRGCLHGSRHCLPSLLNTFSGRHSAHTQTWRWVFSSGYGCPWAQHL